jgi:hypothetical protein
VAPAKLLLGVLASMAVACSSADGVMLADAGQSSDASEASDAGQATEASADAARDAEAPPAPDCPSGDRTEWAGAVPGTLVSVAVCSACGKSYVVAENGGDVTDVSIANGTKTVTTTIPANAAATSAKLADDAKDGSVTVCAMSGTHCLPVTPQNEKYCDPYRDVAKLSPERIDQGVDYGGAGSIYAIGPGHIDVYKNRNDSGWPGGTFVSYKLSAGPASGLTVYLAENIDLNPALKSGSFVYNGTVLGTLVNAYPNSESGWGVPGAGYTAEHSCYTEGCTTALGVNFNELLTCIGSPSGIKGTSGCCTSTAGFPSGWCKLVDGWQ